uniref:ATP synthase subunit a n=1 Tax=Paraleonnates uschakovi TaxID=1922336 RepID=A0A343A8R5_9ANNE|nr:ATP synthase F0 subunit 6 [Paraleonnates uschakovi]APG32415.1 ATP synthase F0 subunit 6 [Paraleonnates uschakovi]
MMLDIFSSFDPGTNLIHSSFSPSMFWISIMTTIMIFSGTLWTTPSPITLILFSSMSIMNEQSNRTSSIHIKGMNHMLVTLFIMIIVINLMGLLPAVFSFSSHLIFTLSFGLPLWMTLIISGIMFNPSSWAASLLPGGAPDWLNPFLVIIETISITVRPITLSFRLAANMSAGHIVLALMSSYGTAAVFSSIWTLILIILTQIGYIMFEFGICLIQAYIFCLLLSLYSNDHP